MRAVPPHRLTPEDRERSQALIAACEARLRQAETFTWTVPGLALTGQAFLLTIALDYDREAWQRAVAAFAGMAALAAALQFLGKHTFNFDYFEAALERERMRLGYDRITRSHLVADIKSFPEDTLLRQREWLFDEGRVRRLNRAYRLFARVRNRLIVRTKAVWVWPSAIAVFFLIDLGLFILSIVQWC